MKLRIKNWHIILYYCILFIGLSTTVKINNRIVFCGENYIGSAISFSLLLLPHLWILIELIMKLKKKQY